MVEQQDRYVDAVCREMEMRRDEVQGSLSTVYIGGGTPSVLSPASLQKIFSRIEDLFGPMDREVPAGSAPGPGGKATEVTMECNPDDVTAGFCAMLNRLPVNRISMGAQTFSDERLKFLHRRHNAAEVATAVGRLRDAGIGNISIDLMFGFPGETLADWQSDIDKAIALRPEHISAYSLQYEEGTPLYRMLSLGRIHEIDDELYRSMYTILCEKLSDAGFEHYEISNFARPGFRSRHNSSYWHNIPYVGLGASAHSYSGATRSWNVSDLRKYISSIEGGILPSNSEQIDEQTHYDDMVMTALRTREGIDLDSLPPRFRNYIMKAAASYLSDGEMHSDGHRLALTRKGIFVSDMIMADLMMPD